MKARIALVEDDPVISRNYADFLRGCGLEVATYSSKETALAGLRSEPPELALLDITLGNERDAGFEICADLRHRHADTPIVFLTSHDGEIDKISGLRLGADDYLTKDVSLDFLIVRIEALFRRRDAYSRGRETPGVASTCTEGGLQLNPTTCVASWSGQPVELSLTQYWMVAEMYRHPGRALSHEELMRAAKLVVEPNTITAHIKAIRDAFRRVDGSFDRISTERGRGYRWLHG
jgi:two-component system, OmpR family, response regulator